MTNPATTLTSPCSAEYARRVGKRMHRMSPPEREELVIDLAARLDATSPSSYADLVGRFGAPEAYAKEMAEAMGLPTRRSHRRLWIGATAISVALLMAWMATVLDGRDDVAEYPISFGSSMTPADGVVESVGSTFLVHADPARNAEIEVDLSNNGGKTVHVEAITAFESAKVDDDGGLVVGAADVPPIWSPHVRVFRQADPLDVVISRFDDPSGFDFHPFDMAPGEHVVIGLQGPVNYCIAVEGSVEDRLRLATTIAGEQREVVGPAVVFKFDGCP